MNPSARREVGTLRRPILRGIVSLDEAFLLESGRELVDRCGESGCDATGAVMRDPERPSGAAIATRGRGSGGLLGGDALFAHVFRIFALLLGRPLAAVRRLVLFLDPSLAAQAAVVVHRNDFAAPGLAHVRGPHIPSPLVAWSGARTRVVNSRGKTRWRPDSMAGLHSAAVPVPPASLL